MPVTLKVKSENAAVKAQREAVARRVTTHSALHLPKSRLLCFCDDEDPLTLKRAFGVANRGLYGPIHDGTPMADWPDYVANCIYLDDGIFVLRPRVVDDLVYLYDSACSDEAGMTMTLAHELQHAIQHANARQLCAVNSLIQHLPERAIVELKLEWADIPTEREARIVAKQIALDLCGKQSVSAYIEKRMSDAVESHDAADWRFIYELTPSSSVDLCSATRLLFQRLGVYRGTLDELLQDNRDNMDFSDIDLNAFS